MNVTVLSLFVAAVSGAMLLAPTLAAKWAGLPRVLALLVLTVIVALTADVRVAFGLSAVVAFLHAVGAWKESRTGAVSLVLSGGAAAVAAFAFATASVDLGFVASLLAIALRAGVVPVHVGTSELCDRAPREQVRQLATLLPLVLAHVHFAANAPLAHSAAPVLFLVGAIASLLPGLAALAQRELTGLYRMTTLMHGGYLICAVAAAGRGHDAAALFAGLTLLLAVGGFGLVVSAISGRCGSISLLSNGGRVSAFPHLAAAFAVLGAAGVGLPATAGFVADDLLLHAAWEDGVIATTALIVASVALAVATLRGYSRVFLGPAVTSVAPDLVFRERVVVVAIIAALLALGLAPQYFIRALAV